MMNFLRKQMKWVMAVIVVAFLLSTFLMYEGRSTRRTPERNADGTMSDYEVAQINGRSLMRSELERRVREYLSNYNSRSAENLDMPSIYQTVLNQAILELQLVKEVDESGIRVSDAEAEQVMKNYADTYFPTRETFYQGLANSGMKIEDYKRGLARRIAVEQLYERAVGEVNISEDRAVEFYDTMKNLIYSKPEGFMIHAANFNKKEDAEVLREKLLSGESWDVIISNDELASHDVINITREPVFLPSTALTTGAFSVLSSLDVGVVSPVFEVTSFDFAVGLKTQHVDASVTPYDEVSADIKALLTQQEQRNRVAAYETSLINKAQVVINDESLFARNAVTSPDVTIPELTIDDIAEVSADTKTESEEETVPAIVSDEVKEEEPKPEPVKEEAKEEVKSEDVKAEPEAKPEDKTSSTDIETASEEPKPKEVTEPEAKTDEPAKEEAKSEDVKAEPEVKPEDKTSSTDIDTVSEEPKPKEVTEPEAKTDEPAKEEAKSEDVKAEPEVKSEDKTSSTDIKTASEEPKPKETVTESSSDVKEEAK